MKRYKKFLMSALLLAMCASMCLPNGVGLYADTDLLGNTNSIGSETTDTNESYVGKDVTQGKHTEYENGVSGENSVNVHITVASAFDVVIPKTIILSGESKTGQYSVKVKGDLPGATRVHVVPDSSFTLSQTEKEDVTATVSQDKTEWGIQNLSTDAVGTISALDVTSGAWNGTFNFNISFDGTPSAHTHSYTEEIIKEATCGEAGSKKLTCSCGDVKTEEIPATGNHNYVDGICSECGGKEPCTSHVDVDNNHLCDNCNEKISECADANNDHNCDTCGAKLSEHSDENSDHNCDVCGSKVSDHVDEDGDGNCDECGNTMHEHIFTFDTYKLAEGETLSCTKDISVHKGCSCGEYEEATSTLKATGHKEVDGVCTICGQKLSTLRRATGVSYNTKDTVDWLGSSECSILRKNIYSIIFEDFSVADGAHYVTDDNAWDISAAQDGSIVAWYEVNSYKDYVIHVAPTKANIQISMPKDSSYMFAYLGTGLSNSGASHYSNISGFDKVDFSKVESIDYWFFGMENAGRINLSSAHMFNLLSAKSAFSNMGSSNNKMQLQADEKTYFNNPITTNIFSSSYIKNSAVGYSLHSTKIRSTLGLDTVTDNDWYFPYSS